MNENEILKGECVEDRLSRASAQLRCVRRSDSTTRPAGTEISSGTLRCCSPSAVHAG
jgi:hypothetical protein